MLVITGEQCILMCNKDIHAVKSDGKMVTSEEDFKDAKFAFV